MKKYVFAFFYLSFVVNLALFAVETRSGDYVIYEDKTFTAPTWIGFLYYDAETYGAVLYTPSANRRIGILFSVECASGKLTLLGQKNIGKIDMRSQADIEAVNYLMQVLPEFYAWGTKAAAKKKPRISYGSCRIQNAENFGGRSIQVKTASYIPLFGIETIAEKSGTALLQLDRIGKVTSDDREFFDFILPFERERPAMLELDSSAQKREIKIDTKTIHLDSQWTANTENSFFLGNSAYLVLSSFSKDKFDQSEFVRLFSLSSSSRIISMEAMSVQGNEKNFTIKNIVYDTERQTMQVDIKHVVLLKDGVLLLSLTVAKADYEKYTDYFNGLF